MSKEDMILERLANVQAVLSLHSELLEDQRKTLKDQSETLLRNTIVVEEHHKRSTMLEERLDETDLVVDHLEDQIKDLTLNRVMWGKIAKLVTFALTALVSLATATWYVLKIFNVIQG